MLRELIAFLMKHHLSYCGLSKIKPSTDEKINLAMYSAFAY